MTAVVIIPFALRFRGNDEVSMREGAEEVANGVMDSSIGQKTKSYFSPGQVSR